MAIAIALIAIVVGSVLFHLVSPWWTTQLASHWQQMDDTLTITLVITGLFFCVINLFIAYTLLRFRHRSGQRAAYEPENHRLERWLIGITTVGIVALLAPGLVVYAEYVQPPRDALVVEVLGQQWQWRYRFPGDQGKFGASDARFFSGINPFGLDPDDPAGQDNRLVDGNELHLPLGKPVKVLLRSHDVLHDFYVPQFRARMNMVPGMVTWFWFTPTQPGRYEALCSQLCGVGHYAMRGIVIVEEESAFRAWHAALPTFAASMTPGAAQAPVARGKALAQSKGCVGCHSVDGSPGAGPTWQKLYGRRESFADGSSAMVDEAFLRREIREPRARVVKGYAPVMPDVALSDDEVAALVAYIRAQGAADPGTAAQPDEAPHGSR